MRDKSVINIPVYRTNPRCVDNSLFPPTRSAMRQVLNRSAKI